MRAFKSFVNHGQVVESFTVLKQVMISVKLDTHAYNYIHNIYTHFLNGNFSIFMTYHRHENGN